MIISNFLFIEPTIKGAKNIIEKGIFLSKGAPSDGDGFYLGIDLKKAVMYARQTSGWRSFSHLSRRQERVERR